MSDVDKLRADLNRLSMHVSGMYHHDGRDELEDLNQLLDKILYELAWTAYLLEGVDFRVD